MSLYVLGNCIEVMTGFPDKAVAQNLANPPYLISFRAVPGTPLPVTKLTSGLQPACNKMYRVLKKNVLMISFYGWNRVDRFVVAWKIAGICRD